MTVQAQPSDQLDTSPSHNDMANAIRALSMDAIQKANSGHPGMPMGMADVATVLFQKFMKFNPQDGNWADRDRFILSAGHGSMLLYSLGYLLGYPKMTLDEIKNFRQLHSLTPGHPEVMPEVGIETTTGPLGQGISAAVGFALAERIMNAKFGDDLVDHHTYVIAGDGCLMEGISHEACSLAGHLNLSKLIVLYDDNGISIDGPTSLSFSDDTNKRFESYGWNVQTIDGHDPAAIEAAIEAARSADKPSLISCKTKIGFGAPTKENSSSAHGSPLGDDEIAGTRKNIGWSHEPFVIPEDVLEGWRSIGASGQMIQQQWQSRLDQDESKKVEFTKWLNNDWSEEINSTILKIKQKVVSEKASPATRKASGNVLDELVEVMPSLIGGSADLTGSNNTYKKGNPIISADTKYNGQYIYYGVREHAMAAAMNGLAQHGGIVPYAGTFLTFSDYNRPSIRLAALMKTQVVHVMTHDSIGLGEDGPTHQAVEHVAALRAIPNCYVYRPCDEVETAECWQYALEKKDAPAIMALTRQGLPTLREDATAENKSANGAYILRDNSNGQTPDVILIATGSEVSIAAVAYDSLTSQGKSCRLISMPCMDLFEEQTEDYKTSVIGAHDTPAKRICVEAAVQQSWDKYLRPAYGDVFIGMNSFGESAPAPQLFEHFGITADAIVKAATA